MLSDAFNPINEWRDRDRWIFWMYYRHGLTASAISGFDRFELTQKGVESTILRLTRQVRDCLTGSNRSTQIIQQSEGKP